MTHEEILTESAGRDADALVESTAAIEARIATVGQAAIARAVQEIAEEVGGSFEVPLGGALGPTGELPKATIAKIIELMAGVEIANVEGNGGVRIRVVEPPAATGAASSVGRPPESDEAQQP